MQINEFYNPDPSEGADIAKFTTLGDHAEGRLAKQPEMIPDKFNEGKTVLVNVLLREDGTHIKLFSRGGQLKAIGEAVAAAVGDRGEIEEGGYLSVAYVGNRDFGGVAPAKVWDVIYKPPAPMGTAEIGDTWGVA